MLLPGNDDNNHCSKASHNQINKLITSVDVEVKFENMTEEITQVII